MIPDVSTWKQMRFCAPDGHAEILWVQPAGGVGPATCFDPAIVAIHVRERSEWNTRAADYLIGLQDRGAIQFWEVGDPDAYPPDEPEPPGEYRELVHPRPDDSRVEFI